MNLGSDYFQNKLDVTRMRCTRKYLNCTAHAIDDQHNGRWVSANQPMVEHRPHAIQLYLDQWARPTSTRCQIGARQFDAYSSLTRGSSARFASFARCYVTLRKN